jgi:hypothetical protein
MVATTRTKKKPARKRAARAAPRTPAPAPSRVYHERQPEWSAAYERAMREEGKHLPLAIVLKRPEHIDLWDLARATWPELTKPELIVLALASLMGRKRRPPLPDRLPRSTIKPSPAGKPLQLGVTLKRADHLDVWNEARAKFKDDDKPAMLERGLRHLLRLA